MSDLENFIANFKPHSGTNEGDDDMDVISQSGRTQRTDQRRPPARRMAPLDPDDLDPQAIYQRRSAARQARQPGTGE